MVGGRLQGWFPLTGLPSNLPAVPGIFAGPPPTFDGTSSQAHQIGDEFKFKINIVFITHSNYQSSALLDCTLMIQGHSSQGVHLKGRGDNFIINSW